MMEQHQVEELLTRLTSSVDKLAEIVDRMERTISGAPGEGNMGILPRLTKLEIRVERLMWTFPFLVMGGTAIGNVVVRWLGL